MKRFLFFLLLIFTGHNLSAQPPEKAPGPGVKTLTVKVTGYSDGQDSTPAYTWSYDEFDASGRSTRHELYWKNQLLFNRPTDSSSQAYYDYTGGGISGEPQKTDLYGYFQFDSIAFEEKHGYGFYLTEYRTDYIYDENHRLIRKTERQDGNRWVKYEYTYSASGLLLSEKWAQSQPHAIGRQMFYVYDKKGKVILKTTRDLNGQLTDSVVYQYDQKGRRVFTTRWKKGILDDSISIRYETNGSVRERYRPRAWTGDKVTVWEHTTEQFDGNDKLLLKVERVYKVSTIGEIKFASANSIDSTIYEWWPSGKPKSENETRYKNGMAKPRHFILYDEQGNATEDMLYDDHELWHGYTRVYDSKGRMIREQITGYGRQNGYYTFTYNERGLVSAACFYTPGGRLLETRKYTYTWY